MQDLMTFIEGHFYLITGGTLVSIFLLSRLRLMEDMIYALMGFGLFAAFLLYIVFTVPFTDLTIVVVIVLIMTAIDFIQTLREGSNGKVDKDPGPDRAT